MPLDPITSSALIQTGGSLLGGLFGGGDSTTTQTTSTLPFTGTTGLGTTGMAEGGAFTSTLDPRFQALQQQAIGAAGGAFGQLGQFDMTPFQATPFDVKGMTKEQFDMLEGLQREGREQAGLSLEDRLFQQGRLGSTGGGLEQRNLQDAISRQQAMNMQSAFGQALGAQQQQFGQEMGVSQQQLAQQQMLAGMGQGMFGTAMSPEQMLMNQMATFGSIAPQQSVAETEEDGGLFGGLF